MASDLQTSFYFKVAISGDSSKTDAAFQEVSGLSKELGVEDVVCGGENRFKYRLPTITTYPNLVLKRGIVIADSPLVEWVQLTLDSGMSKPIKTKNINVILMDEQSQPSMQWNFNKAYPVKWAATDLKSQDNTLLIETIELAYQYYELEDSRDDRYAGVADLFGD